MDSSSSVNIPATSPLYNQLGRVQQKRKYTSKACDECRKRRAKCDGRRPSCARCRARAIDCKYAEDEDARKPAPKAYVQQLRDRVETLTQILRKHSIDVDQAIAEFALRNKSADGSATHENLRSSSASQNDNPVCYVDDLCVLLEGTLSLDEALNYDQDGELRYFGPTSGRLEFQKNLAEQHVSPDEDPMTPFYSDAFNDRSATFGDHTAQELQAHLVDLYFKWQQPWCPILDENQFRESWNSGGRYCTPLLLNCILAAGARFSDRIEIRTIEHDIRTAGRSFLNRAETLLLADLKRPGITTIQALTILATAYHGTGPDTLGWLHQGMAHKLALDLGINLDAELLTKSIQISEDDVELRRQIYWTLYCDDKLSALYTGRVCTMLDFQGAVVLPSLEKPHGRGETEPTATSRRMSLELLKSQIGVCRIIERIIVTFYAPKPLRNQDFESSIFIDSCVLSLRQWLYDLPTDLRIGQITRHDAIPQVFTLHMVYYTTFILLFKPTLTQSLAKGGKDQQRASGIHDEQTVSKAVAACRHAARQTCRVAKQYQRVFGSFKQSPITAMHCTLSAAQVMIQLEELGDKKISKEVPHDIHVCLKVLEELSDSWSPAARIRASLLSLLDEKYPGSSGGKDRSSSKVRVENVPSHNQVSTNNGENEQETVDLTQIASTRFAIDTPPFLDENWFNDISSNPIAPDYDLANTTSFQGGALAGDTTGQVSDYNVGHESSEWTQIYKDLGILEDWPPDNLDENNAWLTM